MARNQAINIQNDFTQGLITETTALRFPENAVTDCDNVVFDETGKFTRRPRIDIEENQGKHLTTTSSASAYTEYQWEDVSGTGETACCTPRCSSLFPRFRRSCRVPS